MNEARAILLNEVRYAERLCQRTARLYRRLQTFGTFMAVLGGSAAATLLSSQVPQAVGIAGMAVAAVFGAALIAMRPADKAAANESDVRRYSLLRSEAHRMGDDELRSAFDKAKVGDAAEIEPLRLVAYNDVMMETGNAEHRAPLSPLQHALAAIA